MIPRDEDHFWHLMEENWRHAVQTLRLRLQTRDEALFESRYQASSQSCIRYREASADNDQREHYYDLGRAHLDRVWELIEGRNFTPELVQLWGVLMFSFGHTVNYQMDDSPVLEMARAGAASARARDLIQQRRWLAHVLLPTAKGWDRRDKADAEAVELIQRIIRLKGVGGFPAQWFREILSKQNKNSLKSTFQQKNFSVKEMEYACSLGVEGLPPVGEELFLLCR
ncbi:MULTISPECIES: hypothetical protein [unclassified Bosea (in: a-proteobacteria)]